TIPVQTDWGMRRVKPACIFIPLFVTEPKGHSVSQGRLIAQGFVMQPEVDARLRNAPYGKAAATIAAACRRPPAKRTAASYGPGTTSSGAVHPRRGLAPSTT